MLLKMLKNISVLMMAVVVLCSTLSFSVHKHFCGPFLKDISMIVPSHGCGMETNKTTESCAVVLEKSCCNDVVELVKGQDDLKLSWDHFNLDQQQFIILFTHSFIYSITGDDLVDTPFTSYSPPLVIRDIPVLHQSFLI
ncbi:HYC_CC_PP family protein [Nonlabens ulvanivorans]